MKRNLIPLALYRLKGALDNESPYIFTNPPDYIKLTSKDKVFVLSYNIPMDLLGI